MITGRIKIGIINMNLKKETPTPMEIVTGNLTLFGLLVSVTVNLQMAFMMMFGQEPCSLTTAKPV